MDEDDGNIDDGEHDTLATWLIARKTGAGKTMFTRIHEACNGLVELYVKPENHKEVIDWARLATSEIMKELSDKSANEIFIDVEDANNQFAKNPDWKPHTLSQRVEHLTPSETPYQARRRPPVAITYGTANSEKEIEQKQPSRVKKETKGKRSSITNTELGNTGGAATTKVNTTWMIPSNSTGPKSTGAPADTSKQTTKTPGANKYKIASAAQDQRMDKIEEAVEAIAIASKNQKEDPRIASLEQHIASIAQSQNEANEALKKVLAGQGETKKFVKELTEKVKYNKKQADKDHKIMTDAMKMFHDNLVHLQTMINALQRGATAAELPTRKKRATSKQKQDKLTDHDSDKSSFNSTKMGPLLAVTHPDNSFQSDAKMDGVADDN
jgi:hypothetical protein